MPVKPKPKPKPKSNEPLNAVTCPVDALLRLISGPWTAYILWLLCNEPILRYGEIRRRIPDISPKILAQRLKLLESNGLISRAYKPTVPPQVSYALTPRGIELKPLLNMLGEISERWQAEDSGP